MLSAVFLMHTAIVSSPAIARAAAPHTSGEPTESPFRLDTPYHEQDAKLRRCCKLQQ